MDEEIERLIVSVRADTGAFAKDVAAMRSELDGPFTSGVERAGQRLENALVRAVRTGKFGFEEMKATVLAMMGDIAAAALRGGIGAATGGRGLSGLLSSLFSSLLGAPGRATGGPVAPGQAYLVGERGPELFVPTASGRVETMSPAAGRAVQVNVTINVPAGGEARALGASSRQVARAVKVALLRVN